MRKTNTMPVVKVKILEYEAESIKDRKRKLEDCVLTSNF